MWEKHVLFGLFIIDVLHANLTGDHICQEEIRSKIDHIEYFPRNITIRQYQWCMNVPPRCSFYSTKVINESRIVAKEVITYEDKCCPGFKRNGELCMPECPTECINGKCLEGKCYCQKGYKGTNCNLECENFEWGENCENQCDCISNNCNSITGQCICPVGFSGSLCTKCIYGFYGENCQNPCNCRNGENCDHISGECIIPETTPEITTTTEEKLITIQMKHENNGQFQSDPKLLLVNRQQNVTNEEMMFSNVSTPTTLVYPENMMKSLKSKVQPKNEVTVTTTDSPSLQQDNFLNDGISHKNGAAFDVDNTNLVNSGTAAAIFVLVLAIAIVLIIIQRVWRKKGGKNDNDDGKKAKESENNAAAYTRPQIIFHTPLPDVPKIESVPFMDRPHAILLNGQSGSKPKRDSIPYADHCVAEQKEIFYEHPPFTGSYRAASKPEPPPKGNDNIIDTTTAITYVTEPVYDEIPLGIMPITPVTQYSATQVDSSILYVNTFCKTRF